MSLVGDGCYSLHLIRDVGERWLAMDHLVEDAAKTPDIGGFTELEDLPVRGGFEGLWGHVIRCSDVLLTMNIDSILCDCIRDAKVDQFELALQQEEISWFQVTVDNVECMNRGHTLQHFPPEVACRCDVKALFYKTVSAHPIEV